MVTECYREFEDSGRMEKTRLWIDSGKISPRLLELLTEMMTVIDCQQAVIVGADEVLTLEYQETCRG
jgi:hypothetical protein